MFVRRFGFNISCTFCRNKMRTKLNCLPIRLIHESILDRELDLSTKLEIENKWSSDVSRGTFDPAKQNKFYVLSMFPYPSGNLHMGHVRVYTISDALARFYRLNGKNVLHPMGFDSFGLPAENAALENKVDPAEWTYSNIATMRNQLKELGLSFDWDREVITCSKDYYKFTQYLFLLLFKHGLVYQKEALVNWDPVDKTVLADEQVDANGRSWRSGALVERKLLKQWFIKTPQFAYDLLKGLESEGLEDWRDVRKLQEHWIGECDGWRFDWEVEAGQDLAMGEKVSLWVRYPEHLRFASYVAASPSSLLVINHPNQSIRLINPFTKRSIPVVVTDECSFDEGCDMKIGIPACYEDDRPLADANQISYTVVSAPLDFEERSRVCELAKEGGIGGYRTSSKLRDWLISRQRRWGTPIPVVHCEECGAQPLPTDSLPLCLSAPPTLPCPSCGKEGQRETDTMDTFVDSSWYFLRYTDPMNQTLPFSQEAADQLMPVDIYVGGKEHATLHLYYARFMSHFLHSVGLVREAEPFKKLLVQGMVMGRTYYLQSNSKPIKKEQVIKKGDELFDAESGERVVESWEKMSKSKHNGVDPRDTLAEYGLDSTRLIILSEVSPQSHRNWDSEKFSGVLNWQRRVWSLMKDFVAARKDPTKREVKGKAKTPDLFDNRNFYLKGITFGYSTTHQLSIVISKLQGLTNTLKKCDKQTMVEDEVFERLLGELVVMSYPVCPHFASELWSQLQAAPGRLDLSGRHFSWSQPLSAQCWPRLDSHYLLELHCKVNNAVKATVKLPAGELDKLTSESALGLALREKKVRSFLAGREVLSHQLILHPGYEGVINLEIDHRQAPRQDERDVKQSSSG